MKSDAGYVKRENSCDQAEKYRYKGETLKEGYNISSFWLVQFITNRGI